MFKVKINTRVKGDNKQPQGTQQVTADMIIDMYLKAKKTRNTVTKDEIMKRVIYLSAHLNEYLYLE
jgi:hypothetical protein